MEEGQALLIGNAMLECSIEPVNQQVHALNIHISLHQGFTCSSALQAVTGYSFLTQGQWVQCVSPCVFCATQALNMCCAGPLTRDESHGVPGARPHCSTCFKKGLQLPRTSLRTSQGALHLPSTCRVRSVNSRSWSSSLRLLPSSYRIELVSASSSAGGV